MSTYQQLKGLKIKYLSSDTSGDRAKEGEVFYNSTSFDLKSHIAVGAWSSSAPTTTKREGSAGFGIQTAAVTCGGETPPVTNLTEEYNGTGWTAGGNMTQARFRHGGAGTLTAGIIFAGHIPPDTGKAETYDGTSWTEVGDLNTVRNSLAGAGTSTSALAFGGKPGYKDVTEEYNGTSWTEVADLNTARNSIMGAGANAEACLAFGGEVSSPPAVATNATESWDGSSWTEVNNLNTARYGAYGAGTLTAAIVSGGIVGPGTMQSVTETWDGTSWTETGDLSTARGRLSMAGTTTAAVAFTGKSPSLTTATEEFKLSIITTTAGAWGSGGNMNTARRAMSGGAGTATAGMVAGGYISTNSNATEEYDGSAWANGGNLPAALYYISIGGTQTAGLAIGGGDPVIAEGIEYNGSSWTDIGNAPESRKMMGRSGLQTAALFAGGNDGPNAASSEAFTYDGSSFTNITDLPSNRGSGHVSGGSQTASVHAAGSLGPPGYTDTTVEWNGSAWGAGGTHLFSGQSQLNSNNTGGYNNSSAGGYGTSAAPSGITGVGCSYDGTSWFTTAPLSTARQQGSGFGGVDDFVACAGTTGSATNATEEFTAETTSLSAKTIDFD